MADLVRIDPRAWGAVREELRQLSARTAGLVALDPMSDLDASVQVYPDMGRGYIAASPFTAAELAKIPGVIVRPARTFRRPTTTTTTHPLVPVIAGLAPGELWIDSDSMTWPLLSIGVDPADDEGDKILVGVIDSGVDAKHPDLATCLGKTVSLLPGFSGTTDDLGHGTHVVGVIAGARLPSNGGPRYGIAPRARVSSYRIYGKDDAVTEATLVAAVRMAVDDGCRIIALASGADGGNNYDAADAELGKYVAGRGAILFAAAGNESNRKLAIIRPTNAPANAPRIYAVGAATRTDCVAGSSNGTADDTARRVDWLAAGVDVISAHNGTQGETLAASGTSAATAVAAGIAAAVWSRNPDWTAAKVLEKLRSFSSDVVNGPATAVGDGRLRIRKE